MPASKKSLYLIDGNSLLYRAFFAVPPFATSKGLPTNAVFGFTKMLLKLIKDKNPDALVVVFDAKGPTFRSQMFEQYKATRPKMPDQLVVQRPYVHQMVEGFRIPIFEIPGIEADDVIGSLAKRFMSHYRITIVTGDKDLMQLVVDPDVVLYDTMKEIIYDRQGVFTKMGVYPEQIIDLLALMGDTSDNIPGIPGVGPKTALTLLSSYKTLEGVYQHVEDVTGALQTKLKTNQELAQVSYKLATIRTDVELETSEDHIQYQAPDLEKLLRLCDELEFTSLKKELAALGTFDAALYEAPKPVYEKRYTTVQDKAMFDRVIGEIRQKKELAFDTETTSLDVFQAELVGVSLSCTPNIGYYVPVAHKNYAHNLEKRYVVQILWELIEDNTIRKYGHNMKYDLAVLTSEREKLLGKVSATSSPKATKKQISLFDT